MEILSNAYFPNYLLSANPSFILDDQYNDFDEQSERLIGFDQTYLQLTPGAFAGRFLSCFLGPSVSVHLEQCNQALEQSVMVHPEAVTIGVVASEGEAFRLRGAPFTSDSVMIAMPGSDLHLRSPVDGAIIALVVQEDHLRDHPGLSAPAKDRLFAPDFGARLLDAPQLARRIREDVVQSIQSANFEQAEPEVASLIGGALLAGVASKLSLEFSSNCTSLSRLLGASSYERFQSGRDAIHESWDAIQNLNDLLIETGCGRRTLQNAFASQVTLGPLAYHRILRLHLAKRSLSDPAQFNHSIGDIAARHDFWNWSQFTKLYQSHFGQLPSDTRRQSGFGDQVRQPIMGRSDHQM